MWKSDHLAWESLVETATGKRKPFSLLQSWGLSFPQGLITQHILFHKLKLTPTQESVCAFRIKVPLVPGSSWESSRRRRDSDLFSICVI